MKASRSSGSVHSSHIVSSCTVVISTVSDIPNMNLKKSKRLPSAKECWNSSETVDEA